MKWSAFVCRLVDHDWSATVYPPQRREWVCARCHETVAEEITPIVPVHGATGGIAGHVDFWCSECRRWISSPADMQSPIETHERLAHPVTAAKGTSAS